MYRKYQFNVYFKSSKNIHLVTQFLEVASLRVFFVEYIAFYSEQIKSYFLL
jgi:hypothetical protein